MKALLSTDSNGQLVSQITDVSLKKLQPNEVLIKTEYSSINYKDALGVTGKGKIFKKNPIIGGIDVAGTVIDSTSENFKAGDFVLATGCGLGESYDGGYAEQVIVPAQNVILRDTHLSAREAMIYGTAGFTAALCLERMERNGQTPELGPILVTGASGGVGQFSISFFSTAGYEVHALTSKRENADHLKSLGATNVIFTSQLELGSRPLETVRFGGAIDNVGGEILGKILAHTNLWGNVCSVGLAASHELHTTVMPFILRGVSLLGASSNNTAKETRLKIWSRLAGNLKPKHLDAFVSATVRLENVVEVAEKMLNRQTSGRTIVNF